LLLQLSGFATCNGRLFVHAYLTVEVIGAGVPFSRRVKVDSNDLANTGPRGVVASGHGSERS
jgi:hypothetical protein